MGHKTSSFSRGQVSLLPGRCIASPHRFSPVFKGDAERVYEKSLLLCSPIGENSERMGRRSSHPRVRGMHRRRGRGRTVASTTVSCVKRNVQRFGMLPHSLIARSVRIPPYLNSTFMLRPLVSCQQMLVHIPSDFGQAQPIKN